MSRKLIYLGHLKRTDGLEVFRPLTIPTEKEWGHKYGATIGPFRTLRGARFMRDCGNNPHCQTVSQAEKLGKIYS